MKKMILLAIGTFAGMGTLFAQDEFDALRYGYTPSFGTARSMAIGGAMGSLGADFSAVSINPAGLGMYRKSDLSISPMLTANRNRGSYNGGEENTGVSRFNMAGIGMVVNSTKRGAQAKRSPWKSVSYGLGINRLANFTNEYAYGGNNYTSSFIEKYAEEFNRLGGINSNSLNRVGYPAFGAYQTYLVDRDFMGDSTQAQAYVPYADGIRQQKRVIDRGGMNEFVFSVGGNYMDKVMLGASMGITRLRFERSAYFAEDDISGRTDNYFKYVDLNEGYITEGTGINLKLGAIFKTSESFRFGLAFHTPTQLYLNDVYSISMESHTDSLKLINNPGANPITTYTQESPSYFEYRLSTPYKAMASATVLFKQKGYLTADVEYVDYSTMRYNFGANYRNEANAMNRVIQNTFQAAVNVRVGGEVRVNQWAFRGGFNYMGSPYALSTANGDRYTASLGFGYRTESWYMDFTFAHSSQQVNETPYVLQRANATPNAAALNFVANQGVLTWGTRF